MHHPEFYPKPPDSVSHKETHISHIFFAGELVFKVKKPVRYSFLDYSTVENDAAFSGRAAPQPALGPVGVHRGDADHLRRSGMAARGWAEPKEYMLVMRRLPDKRMLPFLLDTGQVTASMMRELAEMWRSFTEARYASEASTRSGTRGGAPTMARKHCRSQDF